MCTTGGMDLGMHFHTQNNLDNNKRILMMKGKFVSFRYVLRTGLFSWYLESSNLKLRMLRSKM